MELALGEAQMRKYESGLTPSELDEEISKVGSLLPKEDENSNNQLVIVEGHIFEIDRSVPKIVDYIGPANGVIITAVVTQNGNWQNPVATLSGKITKYGGGSVTSSTATATEEGEYTVTFTATDNANNTTNPGVTTSPVTTSDIISVADLKSKINASNYPDYIGTKVNYKPDDTVAWRVFYYDPETTSYPKGYFGDGDGTGPSKGTIYLKRDDDTNTKTQLTKYYNMTSATANGLAMMKQLNPEWASKDGIADLGNEKAAAGLCDTDNWTEYKVDGVAKYAIGVAPVEMWTKAYNAYLGRYEPSKVSEGMTLHCGWSNDNDGGYGWSYGLTGEALSIDRPISINSEIKQSKVIAGTIQWLASPSVMSFYTVCIVTSNAVNGGGVNNNFGVCPVVSLNH